MLILQPELLNQNESITDSLQLVEYEKECYKILLENFSVKSEQLSSFELSYLYQIANLCPLEGGQAVYRARAIIRLYNNSINYNDGSACNQAVLLRKGIKNDISNDFSVKLIGNPIQKESSFIFSHETNEETRLIIYNAINQQVYSATIPSKTKSMYVPLFGNKTGIYFYVIRGSTGIIGKGKIEIIN